MINFDGMDADELSAAAIVLNNLAAYLRKKGIALTYRKHGNSVMAQKYERQCEMIYERLPEWAK